MPIPECCDPIPIPDCYRSAEDAAMCLLDFVADNIEPLFPACEECAELHVFVNHGERLPVDVGDSLSVSILGISPVQSTTMVLTYRARLRFEVWVGGFPVVQTSIAGFVLPAREEQDRAANFMLGVGTALVRSVTIGATRSCGFCANPRFGSLTPLGPLGGFAGWRMEMETDLS